MNIPKPIMDSIERLNTLIEENPTYIPVPTLSEFLGVKQENLRCCIEQSKCPFGVMWQKSISGNKAFKIPTLTFYLWYTQGIAFKQ